jgi:acyl-CoA synthetase (AMP-forming)/AMP-acid ligase II/acyl carrier protein
MNFPENLFSSFEDWSYTDLKFEKDSVLAHVRRSNDFWKNACQISAAIKLKMPLGEPVLLFYPNGIEFLEAFVACLIAGQPAVPCNIPRKRGYGGRISSILTTTGARYYLTSDAQYRLSNKAIEDSASPHNITAIITDRLDLDYDVAPFVKFESDQIAFIQFTSGSTKAPRGAVVTQKNLLICLEAMKHRWEISHDSVFGTWLPQFHDLGLIFGLLLPLYAGSKVITMRPAAFMQQPKRWLEMLSSFKCTHTAAPSFAYQHCVDNIPVGSLSGINLNGLQMAMNAAEPISPTTIDSFVNQFSQAGFERHMFTPAYGLAESTLAVTGSKIAEPPIKVSISSAALVNSAIKEVADTDPDAQIMISSGSVLDGVLIRITDPISKRDLDECQVGEVWIKGDCIAAGYYNSTEADENTFIVLEDSTIGNDGVWLRSGDLGFMLQGQLFITGRADDILIIDGRNYYPQDIEWIAQSQDSLIKNNCGALFLADKPRGGKPCIVFIQEIEKDTSSSKLYELMSLVHQSVLDEMQIFINQVVFIQTASIPRTSSGKIQRRLTRKSWLEGDLNIIMSREFSHGEKIDSNGIDLRESPKEWLASWILNYQGLPINQSGLSELLRIGRIDLDSRGSAELVAELEASLGCSLSDTLIWDYPTIHRLSDYIMSI